MLTLDGEKVVDAVPHIGYLHSGFEKLGEDLDFNQYVTIVDRMNYISPLANEIAWHHAVEKLLDIELTPRCKYLRTIFAELMRIHDHLLNVGTAALDLGAFTAFLYGFKQREKIYDIFEYASGQRFHASYTRVGGVMLDVNDDWVDKVRKFVKEFPPTLPTRSTSCSTRNRIFIDRTKGIGVLTKEDAINYRRTGPIARASGVVRDLRKDEPYLAYADLDFKVICSTGGDCYARYLVRMREMQESLKIIEQAIENLPAGPVNVESVTDVVLPAKPAVYRSIEGLIQHFEVVMPNRGLRRAARRSLRGHRIAQRRAGLLRRRRRHEPGVPRADAAAVVHSFRLVPAHDSRASVERRGGGAGQPQHHRGGVGSMKSDGRAERHAKTPRGKERKENGEKFF